MERCFWPTNTPSYKLIGINLDTEPPSHFTSGKTWTCNDGLNVGAKACILPLSFGYCDKSSVAGMNWYHVFPTLSSFKGAQKSIEGKMHGNSYFHSLICPFNQIFRVSPNPAPPRGLSELSWACSPLKQNERFQWSPVHFCMLTALGNIVSVHTSHWTFITVPIA